MGKLLRVFLVGVFCFTIFYGSGVMQKKHKKGKWTMDYESAVKYAKKKKKFVFLQFTGSDWCHWCIHMDKKVFSSKEWSEYAKKKLALVYLDFPRNKNKSKVSKKQAGLNNKLAGKYKVSGLPTYYIITPEGKTIYKGGAARVITPKKFIASVDKALESYKSKVKKAEKIKDENS